MSFRLGDVVEYGDIRGVVIGYDTREDGGSGYLVGFDTNRGRSYKIADVSILATDKLISNYLDYPYAKWLRDRNLRLANTKGYSKVNYRTLKKRMRDQIAQEIYKCRK